MQTLKTVILILIALGAMPTVGQASPKSDWLIKAESTVGLITVTVNDKVSRKGSCVVIDEHVVVTAAHVIGNVSRENILCTIQGRMFLPSHVIISDEADVAILMVPAYVVLTPTDVVKQSDLPLRIGSKVTAIGFPGKSFESMNSSGKLLFDDYDLSEGGPQILVISSPIELGMSGGGAFASDGKLIGIVIARTDPAIPQGAMLGVVLPCIQPWSP